MTASEQLQAHGITLSSPPPAVGAYRPAVRTGRLVFTSGQLPFEPNGELAATGKVPHDVSLDAAQAAARRAVINALAALAAEVGDIDRVTRIVRLNVFVNSSPGFTAQADVANGASHLLKDIFGDAGQHTRCAVGVAELPLNSPVELDLIAEVDGEG